MANRVSAALSVLFGKAVVPAGAPTGPASFVARLQPYGSAPRRGAAEVLQAFNTSPWLRAVSWRIAQRVSAVPWELRIRGADEPIAAHPAVDLIARPNAQMGGALLRATAQLSKRK